VAAPFAATYEDWTMQRFSRGFFGHDLSSDGVRTDVSLFLEQKTDYAGCDIRGSLHRVMRFFDLFDACTKVTASGDGFAHSAAPVDAPIARAFYLVRVRRITEQRSSATMRHV
jgi:hypothetical protein